MPNSIPGDILQALGNIPWVGPILPYIVLAFTVAGFVAHAIAPYVAPPDGPYGIRAFLYGLINRAAGNRGYAANASTSSPG